MNLMRKILPAVSVAAVLLSATMAGAADYPSRPIELVVPSSPGGGTDVMARMFAETAGASGGIGMTEVQRAESFQAVMNSQSAYFKKLLVGLNLQK